jgi:amino acid transporter
MSVSSSATPAAGLRRALPFRTVVSTSTGLAYAAISLLGCVQVAWYLAGDSAWIALLIAGVLALVAAFCFSELNALYPSAAAIRQYLTAAYSERASLTVSFGYVLTIVTVIAADSYVVAQAIHFLFPSTPTLLWILVMLGVAMCANLLGIRIAGLVQDLTTYALLISLAAISIIALSKGGFHLNQPTAGLHTPLKLLNAVALGVFVFSAFEWVTPLSEEVNNVKWIPRGMFISLGLLFVSYALFTVAATHLVGLHTLCPGNSANSCTPAPQMYLGKLALGRAGEVWMLVATLFTGVMTFNGGFATASRFLYAAAREATLPRFFARLSVSRAVPWVPVVLLAVASAAVAVVINATGRYVILILVGAVLEAFIYALAGLCVIQLRRRQRDAARSFRIPLGWTIPIVAIVIFSVLGVAAGVTPNPLPLALTVVLFAVSYLYVRLYVPRLRAKEQALREARGSRRRRPSATSGAEEAAPSLAAEGQGENAGASG